MTGIPDEAVEALAVELLMQSYAPRDATSEEHARNRWRLAGYGELRAAYRERARAGLAAALPHLAAPGSFDAAITAALDAQAGHLLNLTVEVCSCGRPWTDVRDWARHRMAEGLDAALTVLGYGPSRGPQAAVDASEPSEGRSGHPRPSQAVTGEEAP